ncbi:hypothetical protein Tco_1043856 [Tanacetum coccineum]|uniref:Uncharacterized protein n=1 Tax=Tanacetum coccineum TaxID=301880 RepID=A0ABQ5GN88_9ASTR
MDVLASHRNTNIAGHTKFQVVSKLKALKKPLRKLLQEQGNLHDRVSKLIYELDEVQKALDLTPDDLSLRDDEAIYVQSFNEAKLDEERFLKQKAKVEWLEADNLFIFARGDVESARVIMDSLDEFKKTSGLVTSIPKSTTFFCNVLNHVKLPFSEGELPVKYLGVPLISLRLLNKDCKVLIVQAKNRMLIRGFLWCNGEYKRGKAKVAWDDICLPKHEGGLGIRSLDLFNIA